MEDHEVTQPTHTAVPINMSTVGGERAKRLAEVEECAKKVQAILDEYKCAFDVWVRMDAKGNHPHVNLVPREEIV